MLLCLLKRIYLLPFIISTPQPETATITITNILGEKVKEFKATTSADTQVTLDAPAGIYFVTGVTSGSTQTEKVEVYWVDKINNNRFEVLKI